MSIKNLGGALGESLGSSLTVALSLKPVAPVRLGSIFQTMVPTGYTKLQEDRLAMADLGGKAEAGPLQNGYRQEAEGRRLLDRASRSSVTLSDPGDGGCPETAPMLAEWRLSGEDASDEGDGDEAEAPGPDASNMPKESPLAMALQILVPFLLAGFGTVSAGMVLDIVQVSWAESGKGLELKPEWMKGSYAVQATVVGFLAAVAAVVLGWIPEGKFQMSHAVLLCSSSVATAFIASLLQGIIMVGVIVGSKKTGINPDNVATPIAASFGDLITLAILAWISQGLYRCLDSHPYVSSLVCAFFMCLTPLWIVVSSKHPASRTLLYSGWEPVITAMVISSIGGLILDKTVSDPKMAGIVVYTPVINGIGGNLVAIQSSRISTHLHFHCAPGEVPDEAKGCYYPCRTFCGTGANHRSAQVLLLLVVPGHLIFLYTIHLMKSGHTTLTPIFMSVYLAAALLQVLLLLCISDWMVHSMWRSGKDPDSFSIPYLTALGDLLGTALLALSFHFLWLIGDQDSDVGD
uniref:Solute carrier family 41 member n=1 Tax=Fundulus heteroclitus TaxID=8078 RepID=A0A3Q2PLG6_FUNHE